MSLARMTALTVCLALAAVTQIKAQDEITIEGRVVCVNPQGTFGTSGQDCSLPDRFALQTDQGNVFKFLESDSRAEILQDERIRQKRLRVKGWLRGTDQIEIIKLQSVRDGNAYDLYYRCEVCNITAYAGGPCPCCRDELEFHETPAP